MSNMAIGKRPRSVIWDYFEKDPEASTKAKCMKCGDKLQYSKNTSNLLKHLSKKHPVEYDAAMKDKEASVSVKIVDKQSTISQAFQKAQSYSRESEKSKSLDKCLVDMLTTDMQPASIVEDEGFKKFVNALDGRYSLPSRRKIMRERLPKEYEEAKSKLLKLLDETKYIALTTDIWTSRQTQAYICVTGHFITSDWEMKAVILETTQLTQDHTAETIRSELERVANEWKISDKITLVVSDNASNMIAAIRLTKWHHLPCYAHTLNLVVSSSIEKNLNSARKKVKNIVTYFHSSVKASDRLKEIQEQNKLPEHKLIQDVDTRWNSTYYMIDRYIEQHDAITTVLCLLGRSEMCLPSGDLEIIKAAVKNLEPFEEITREVSAEQHLSVSKVIPITRMLQVSTMETVQASQTLTAAEYKLHSEIQLQMKKRFSNIEANHRLAASTFLDPRFKRLAFASPVLADQVQNRLTTEMCSTPVEETDSDSNPDDPEPSASSNEIPKMQKKSKMWDWFDRKTKESEAHRTSSVEAALEMRHYVQGKLLDRSEDPLTFWKNHGHIYPRLSILANRYLSAPATSVPSERLYSKAGDLISAKRNRLKPKNVNMFLFLNKNMSQIK